MSMTPLILTANLVQFFFPTVDFEQANVCWVHIEKIDKRFRRQDRLYHALCCSVKCEQNLLTNSI